MVKFIIPTWSIRPTSHSFASTLLRLLSSRIYGGSELRLYTIVLDSWIHDALSLCIVSILDASSNAKCAILQLKKKVALHEDQLKKYKLPDFPEPDPDPEIVSAAQLYALKKLGYKNKNYLPVGRRGIYGGTIQNMHLHWKKHETVQIRCDTFAKEKLQGMGEQLERLSGGIMVDIHEANKSIVMWRGRNYKRPSSLIPAVFDHFNKRKVKSNFLIDFFLRSDGASQMCMLVSSETHVRC
jgi:hypothetical protein